MFHHHALSVGQTPARKLIGPLLTAKSIVYRHACIIICRHSLPRAPSSHTETMEFKSTKTFEIEIKVSMDWNRNL